jgi:hypothetical protein
LNSNNRIEILSNLFDLLRISEGSELYLNWFELDLWKKKRCTVQQGPLLARPKPAGLVAHGRGQGRRSPWRRAAAAVDSGGGWWWGYRGGGLEWDGEVENPIWAPGKTDSHHRQWPAVAHDDQNWTSWRERWSGRCEGWSGQRAPCGRGGGRGHGGGSGLWPMAAHDWEALRRCWSSDEGVWLSRGIGKLWGEGVHRLGDSSHDRHWDDARCRAAASNWARWCGGAEAVAGCRWLLHEEEKASEALPRRWDDKGWLEVAHRGQWRPAVYGDYWVTGRSVTRAVATGASRLSSCCEWQVGRPFSDFSRFSIFQNLKSKSVTFSMSKIHQILHRDSCKHKKQLSFLAQLQSHSGFHVTNSGTNSNLNLPWILKGFKPFWKNLINSLKFYLHMIFTKVNLVGYTYM